MQEKRVLAAFSIIVLFIISYPLLGCTQCQGCGCDSNADGDGGDEGEDSPSNPPQVPPPSPFNPERCVSSMEIPDDKDNDCDGAIDEEDCDDGFDNDGDGEIDEGCSTRDFYLMQQGEEE